MALEFVAQMPFYVGGENRTWPACIIAIERPAAQHGDTATIARDLNDFSFHAIRLV